jgi:cell division protein FtsB
MTNFQEKNHWRKIIYSKVTIVILLLLLIFVINSVFNIYEKYKKSREGADLARSELENLKERQATLENKINSLKQESGIEAEIRDKFAVAKPGEKVIVLVEDKNNVQDTTIKEKSWWQKFLDLWSE